MEELIKCTKCLEYKPRSSFANRPNRKSGLKSSCRVCSNIVSNNYKKSKEGLIRRILVQQKRSSKMRLHSQPEYTLNQFREWFYSQENFEQLYINWVSSDYDKNLTPSVDRLDDLKPYIFENIRLVTWKENRDKSYKDKLEGVTRRDMKTVYQYDDNLDLVREFHSCTYASKQVGVTQSNLSICCRNFPKKFLGFYWSYNKLYKLNEI